MELRSGHNGIIHRLYSSLILCVIYNSTLRNMYIVFRQTFHVRCTTFSRPE